MDLIKFEALVVEFAGIQFSGDWEIQDRGDKLLEQIADIHTTDPERYEPIMRKHGVTY